MLNRFSDPIRGVPSTRLERVNTVIVGGGPAGIATAAGLSRRGLDAIILERGGAVALAWRNHYDSLHLHTNKGASGLPGRPMPGNYPRYPSRDQVVDYLEEYAVSEGVRLRLNSEVANCHRTSGLWETVTTTGEITESDNVVIATGLSQIPNMPRYPKQELYEGEIVHSSDYRNGRPYFGRYVLVVGFGNSGGEIALDLMEHGAHAFISVRNPGVVVPRDVAGIPALTIASWLSVFPPKVGDWLSKPLIRIMVGDLSKVGIPKAHGVRWNRSLSNRRFRCSTWGSWRRCGAERYRRALLSTGSPRKVSCSSVAVPSRSTRSSSPPDSSRVWIESWSIRKEFSMTGVDR